MSDSQKDKYLQIFNYLLEFSKIRSKPVRDIESQESQYPEKIFLADIPECKLFENIIRESFSEDNEYWLSVRQPKEPDKPVFDKFPPQIKAWVQVKISPVQELTLLLNNSVSKDDQVLQIADFPQVRASFEAYLSGDWLTDKLNFEQRLSMYSKAQREYESLNSTYKKLFTIYNKAIQFGEEYELIIGAGLLNFQENSDSIRIYRHLFTQRVEINFEYSQRDSKLLVVPNPDSTLKIETDAIIDLFDRFDSQNIVEAERATYTFMQDEGVDHILDGRQIFNALQVFASRFSVDGRFTDSAQKPRIPDSKPTVSFAPALILRKRNTRSFTALYQSIIENIQNADDDLQIAAINDLVESDSGFSDPASSANETIMASGSDFVYFPKEYNHEQMEIVERTQTRNKVLVQGPPGTGKSHTIANLICHLLACGKNVLVTAYTKRALEVLKGQLPTQFQDLAVSLLSGDASDTQGLQASVNTIIDEFSRTNVSELEKEITELGNALANCNEQIAFKTNELVKIKERSTRRQVINSTYAGTLTEIAQQLELDSLEHDWYTDSFASDSCEELLGQLKTFIPKANKFRSVDTAIFGYDLPDVDKLPLLKDVNRYADAARTLLSKKDSKTDHELVDYQSYSESADLLQKLEDLYSQIESHRIVNKESILESYRKAEDHIWKSKLELSSQAFSDIEGINLAEFDRDIEITYQTSNSLKQLKNDAQTLLTYIQQGNTLMGTVFRLKKSFLPTDIKEKLYFIESVKVNGSPCDTVEEFESVLLDLKLKQCLQNLSTIWNHKIPDGPSYVLKIDFFRNLQSEVNSYIKLLEDAETLRLDAESVVNAHISQFDRSMVSSLIQAVEHTRLMNTVNEYKALLLSLKDYFTQSNMHPISNQLFSNLRKFDTKGYEKSLKHLQKSVQLKEQFEDFENQKQQLSRVVSGVVQQILRGSYSTNDFARLKPAIHHRHARNELSKLLNTKYEQETLECITGNEQKKKEYIAEIASKKAWKNVIKRLQENRALRQHLEAWVQAVRKIGKSGKGKRALKFRKEAQAQMEHCKYAVPCWIMPLYKVAETISPEQGMCDYVLIDEASQLGPDAIFLLYISKNVIIVGDDKQTSPMYTGVDANSMLPYINKHLQNIPFKNFYGTEFSFFDHARRFCEGITVLREHFRCMPEIIEFSNRYFYAPDGKALYPLKQYSEKRLVPLKSVYCQDGYVDGRGQRIVNQPEAQKIASTIGELTKDDQYKSKSFGVITLQGNQQATLIEKLLLKTIGEREFHARRIVCGNSASFQGDERDVMFLSLVTAHNHNRSALTKLEYEQRFNVAMSRAKDQVWLFHSVELDDLTNQADLRYKLLDHFKNYKTQAFKDNQLITIPKSKARGTQPKPYDSWFEVEVRNDIVLKGYSVIPQYEVAKGRYRIDLVVILPNGTKIAIECDGDKWHGEERYRADLLRQKDLERCGWTFFRVRGHEYYTNRAESLNPLWELLNIHHSKPEVEPSNGSLSQDKLSENSFDTGFDYTSQLPLFNEAGEQSQHSAISIHTSHNTRKSAGLALENKVTNKISSMDALIFTNKFTVYKLKVNGLTSKRDILAQTKFDAGERPLYITRTKDYSGFLLTAYENGKIAKVAISSFITQTNRKRLKNAYSDLSKLVYIKHFLRDDELVAVSTINKVLVFNTSAIPLKAGRGTQGVQVLEPKNNSKLKIVRLIKEASFENVDYYRKNIPATGSYLLKTDKC